MSRIVLAFAGRDVSFDAHAIAALRAAHAGEVIAATVDLGEGKALEAVRNRALAGGAARAHVLDAREEFARDYQLPALRAGAIAEDGRRSYHELARLVLASKVVDVARIEAARIVAHALPSGAAGPFERAVRSLDPSAEVIAVPGAVESAAASLPHEPAAQTPREPAAVDIAFEGGVPAAINGVEMPILELISSLSTLAAVHGIGAAWMLEGEVDDARALPVLSRAHRALQRRTVAPDIERVWAPLRLDYAQLIAEGRWFTPLREALDAFVSRAQAAVSGTVRLELFNGTITTTDNEA